MSASTTSPLSRFHPLLAALRGRLKPRRPIEDIADRVITVEPASESWRPPAIFIESELDKIVRANEYSTAEIERNRMFGGKVRHEPLIRYEFSDALVFPYGFSVKDHSFARYGAIPLQLLATGEISHLRRAHYSGSTLGTQFFGHCIRDSCATALLTGEDEALILPYQEQWAHWEEYRSFFSLAPLPPGLFHVGELIFHSDFAQGPSRIQRYRELRARLREALPEAARKGEGKRIFLRRGAAGAKRAISNEGALIEALMKEGFEILDTAGASVSDIMHAAMDADLCVTMEGSHHIHAFLFLHSRGSIVHIQPSDRINCVLNDYLPQVGMGYGFVIGARSGAGYEVDIPNLLKTADLVANRRAVAG